jgi:hypothetical protein
MTTREFKQTMFQIDSIKWINSDTLKETYINGDEKIVDAFFSATNGIVSCTVYIKNN